jgi:ATP-dependent exoDNAse (exonuclease V) alpha subunit
MDEASMVANPDLADVVSQAADSGAKVILAGDTQQLQAVENGGGLALLAGALGFVQLAEPVRFRAAWEQAASLRLRVGDATVLAEYDQHARIRGGEPEQMMDAAAAHYLALALDGTDVLLMAADHALRRELSRRIRDDLIRLGVVHAGPAVRIADGTWASPGDLIVCTRNDYTVEAGGPGRTLANGDLIRIEAVTSAGLTVRRALDADPATGQRRWTGQQFLYAGYRDAELGYAVTDHVAQSRTVHTGLAVIAGTEDRQHVYVALSRGTDMEHGVCVHGVAEARGPGAWFASGPGAGPLRPDHRRASGPARRRRRGGRDVGRSGTAVRRAGPRRPAPVRFSDPAAGPGQRRSPGHPERDLDRPGHSGPRAGLPGPAHEIPAAGVPARAGLPGQMAVADDAGRGAGWPAR